MSSRSARGSARSMWPMRLRRPIATLRAATRAVPASVLLASVLLLLLSLMWAVLVPGFRGPDELQHLNSVVRLAEGGGWPRPGEALIEDEVADAASLAGLFQEGGSRTVFPAGSGVRPEGRLFADVAPPGVDDRASFHELDGGRHLGGGIDQMTQHPPGYYALAAALYSGVGAGDWRYDRAMFLLRAFTALMVSVTLPVCCYIGAKAVSGRSSVGVVASFVPLLIPELHFVSGVVTNDGATIAATAAMWAVMLVILASGPTRRRLVVLGLAVGAACWTKGTAVALLPVVPLAVTLAHRRARGGTVGSWGPAAFIGSVATLALALVLGGWWWALNLFRYGRVQPSGYPVAPGEDDPIGVGEFVLLFFQRLRWTFFGEMGLREPPPLAALTATLALVFVALCGLGLVSRGRRAERFVMVVGFCTTLGILFATTLSAHLQTGRFPGIQGRYLFVLLVPIAVLVAMGLARVTDSVRLSTRWWPPVVALAGVCVGALGVVAAFRIFYVVGGRPDGAALDLFLRWSAWSPRVLWTLVGTFIACVLALVLALERERRVARRKDADEFQVTQTS